MQEWYEPSFHEAREQQRAFAVLFYTPMCGSCHVVERQLDIIAETVPELTLVKMNLNYLPKIVQTYQIQSVPSVYRFDTNGVVKRLTVIDNVTELYRELIVLKKK
ncbi:thioredoxin family protein [Brochothrix campestris]